MTPPCSASGPSYTLTSRGNWRPVPSTARGVRKLRFALRVLIIFRKSLSEQFFPLILLVHIRARVDLDQDAAWRTTKESRSAGVVENIRFHANATFLEFLIES